MQGLERLILQQSEIESVISGVEENIRGAVDCRIVGFR